MFLSPDKGERLGEGVTGGVRRPLSPPLPQAGERRKKGEAINGEAPCES